MADVRGVWGIDIGQCGLKAVRLVYAEAANQVLATHFDYIAHPKILSQPDANPEELIGQALDTFLARNQTKGDGIAISVPGQSALARFIQLPPVEPSKVIEIVKYEARQQIPFALEEVIWDYQPLGGSGAESGFMLDAEVGLFAMKRDQVMAQLNPFVARKVEVDLIQIAPLALYNYLCHDQFSMGRDSSDEEERPYNLVLDMGSDNTTLLVSNGKKIWIRNVPMGGNHFTRALTKEMKLTFAKAEHLKCNATKAPDPKAVFQALRPVFNDYVTEIQRSIGYFSSVNRDAKLAKILGVGNGFKLAGLQKFLQQHLQMDVERVEQFPGLVGDTVLNAPLFQENVLAFAVPYGLALQGLQITRVRTSLLPPEISTARLVRKKKPWAVAAAAAILAGMSLSTLGYGLRASTVSTATFGEAEKKADAAISQKNNFKSSYDSAVSANTKYKKDLETMMVTTAGRTHWLEVYKAIEACLPRDIGDAQEVEPSKRNRIRLVGITTQRFDNLGDWYKTLPEDTKKSMRDPDSKTGPTGIGYVFTLQGVHFHQDDELGMSDAEYVRATLVKNLQQWTVPVRDLTTGEVTGSVPVRKIGIKWPALTAALQRASFIFFPEGMAAAQEAAAEKAKADAKKNPQKATSKKTSKNAGKSKNEGDETSGTKIERTAFTVQFVWLETPADKRVDVDPDAPKVETNSAQTPAGDNAAAGNKPAGTNSADPASNPQTTTK